MEILVYIFCIFVAFICVKTVCHIKSYYQFTWRVQRLFKKGVNHKFLKKFGKWMCLPVFIVCIIGCTYSIHKAIFMWLLVLSLLVSIIVDFFLDGYKIITSTTGFLKLAVPKWFLIFYIISAAIWQFSLNNQINGYLLYFVIVLVMCLLWFIVISLASLRVMEMVGKLLKSGAAILGATWAAVYAFIYFKTPSFIASVSNVSLDEVLEELSETMPNDSIMVFDGLNVLELFKVSMPIVVLPFLLIMIITEATYYTKNYWIKHHNYNRDIANEVDD